MTTGAMVMRILIGAFGVLLLIGGILLALTGHGAAFFGTIWMIGGGVVLIIAAILEISRYRSEAADRTRVEPGPGGGETTLPEARFRPTNEVFVDPTSQRRMRVFADPNTGERRYVAEA